MDKDKNKGLADTQEGEFILNESGTSVSIDPESEFPEDENLGNNGQTNERSDEEFDGKKDKD